MKSLQDSYCIVFSCRIHWSLKYLMGKKVPEKKPAHFALVSSGTVFIITFHPHQIFLNKCPNLRKKLLVPCVLDPPSANCYVCVSKPEVTVKLNVQKTMVLTLQDRVTQSHRNLAGLQATSVF